MALVRSGGVGYDHHCLYCHELSEMNARLRPEYADAAKPRLVIAAGLKLIVVPIDST
jgi:hypothetical protein